MFSLTYILCSILMIDNILAYFEQKLIRRAFEYEPNIYQKIDFDTFDFPQCPQELQDLNHNSTFVTQLPISKDLFYNVEVSLGENTTMELFLDLTSPWTWYKSETCKRCSKKTNLFSFQEDCKTLKKDCSYNEFNKSYDSPNWQDVNKSVKIFSDDQMILGKFQMDDINFMAYNSQIKLTLAEYIEEKLGKGEPLNLIKVRNLRMINVNRIIGLEKYLADGALGLGFGFEETQDDESEPDTDFLQILIKENTQLKLTRQRFAIYCLETGLYFPNYVVQFGDYDVKYSHRHMNEMILLPRVQNSGYYWMVQMNSYSIKNRTSNQIIKTDVTKQRAIFTLSSQFIELPKMELAKFIQIMNSLDERTECQLIDDELLMVYCSNLVFPTHFTDIDLQFHFAINNTQEVVVDLSSHLMYRNCSEDKKNPNLQNCLLNIKYSKSNYFILGEPFMKWHYVIFDNEPSQQSSGLIGILPAASNMYYEEHPKPIEWSLQTPITYIFILGIFLIFCTTNIRRCMKELYRSIKYQKKNLFEDQQKLKVRTRDDDFEMEPDNQYDKQYFSTPQGITLSNSQQQQIQDQAKEEEWKKSNEQFDFQQKFEQNIKMSSLEDHSL